MGNTIIQHFYMNRLEFNWTPSVSYPPAQAFFKIRRTLYELFYMVLAWSFLCRRCTYRQLIVCRTPVARYISQNHMESNGIFRLGYDADRRKHSDLPAPGCPNYRNSNCFYHNQTNSKKREYYTLHLLRSQYVSIIYRKFHVCALAQLNQLKKQRRLMVYAILNIQSG